MTKHRILDISRDNYFEFVSDLLYIETGLQRVAQSDIFVMGSDSKLVVNSFWDDQRNSNVTDSGIYFVFTPRKKSSYSCNNFDLRVIFTRFRNLDNLHNYLRERFGLISDNLIFTRNEVVYRGVDDLYTKILTFEDLGMKDIARLKSLIDERKFVQNRNSNMFYRIDKDAVFNGILNNEAYYDMVLGHLIGRNVRSRGYHSIRVMGRNTLEPVIYFGDGDTDIDMIKYKLLKYMPADCIEIAEMNMYQYIFHYKISLKFTKNIFMSIFHELYIDELDLDRVDKNKIHVPRIL